MQLFQIASLFLLALVPQLALAQDECCNAALPVCPTPPIKFGVGPACCAADATRCPPSN
ncbi:hypothetical protein K439DRAFT_1628086 [Ramaria rubella]|nr:hypothetical protein K439DRAFT_1628086 [Ramaria rubella]